MSNEPSERFTTPVGRLVGGHPLIGQTQDGQGNPLTTKQGPNAGQPRTDFYMGLAIPKDSPEWPGFYATIAKIAAASFPNLFDAQGNMIGQKFSFKIIDGDSMEVNSAGNRPCDKEGYPGHYVVNFSGGFAPKCYTKEGAAQIVDPNMIKKGFWIRIAGGVVGNGNLQQPGVYMNHSLVELIGHDTEIVSGPDASAVFGNAPAAHVPAHVSQAPVGGAPFAQQAPAQQFGGGQPQQQAPAQQFGGAVQPDHSFANGGQPQQQAPNPAANLPF